MSKIKKITSMFLVLTMLFVTTITTFAADGDLLAGNQWIKVTKTITVDGEKVVDNNIKFDAYQILIATKKGDTTYVYSVAPEFEDFFAPSEEDNGYGNYTFDVNRGIILGTGIVGNGSSENTNKPDSPTEVVPTPEMSLLTANMQKYISDRNKDANNENNVSVTKTLTNGVQDQVPFGYYMVLESASKTGTPIVASKAMLTTVIGGTDNDVDMFPKDDDSALNKVILDKDDAGVAGEFESNDAQVGDPVNYKVTANVPTYDKSTTSDMLYFTFSDTLSEGLKLADSFADENVVIKLISGTGDETTTNILTAKEYDVVRNSDTKFTIDFTTSGKEILLNAPLGSRLDLTYTATLTSNAFENGVDKTNANTNKIELKYTNNPNVAEDYNTLDDTVVTYAYKLGITKFANEKPHKLANAIFGIYESENDANAEINCLGKLTTIEDGTGVFKEIIDGKVTDNDLALDTQTYYIKELDAPKGYAVIAAPIAVTIRGNKYKIGDVVGDKTLAAGDELVGKLNGTASITAVSDVQPEGTVTIIGGNTLQVGLEIINYKGISLPGTGGIGTQGFLMIGGALVLIAGGLFIAGEMKRKKTNK